MFNPFVNTYSFTPTTPVPVVSEEKVIVNIVANSSYILFATPEKAITFPNTHKHFAKAKEIAFNKLDDNFFTQEEIQEIYALEQIINKIKSWTEGDLVVTDSTVNFRNKPISEDIQHFLLSALELAEDYSSFIKPWSKFLEQLDDVSSHEIYNTLFNFLRHNDLKINSEGNILAYKVVTKDFLDKYTNTIDNSVGSIVTEERRKISADSTKTCSFGLHACSLDYLRSTYASRGDNLILVEIKLKDIVCVPNDYKGTKIRVCEYKVVEHLGVWGTDYS